MNQGKQMGERMRWFLLCMALVMSGFLLLPERVQAANSREIGDFTITTKGQEGDDYEYIEGEKILRILSREAITIANKEGIEETDHKIEVADSVSANITLAGVKISVSQDDTSAFKIADNSRGDVTITLKEGTRNVLESGGNCAGLQKNGIYSETLGTLIIQGKGILEATGGDFGAGIGGGNFGNGSNITIAGGTVTATGGYQGAGIGGGQWVTGSNITITGGIVTATGGAGGAGIGGGFMGHGSKISILEGIVTARGGSCAAVIGGGQSGKGTGIIIRGGSVNAIRSAGGNATGGGMYEKATIPTNSHENGEPVYLLTIENPEEEKIYIDGEEYAPIKHTYYQNGKEIVEAKIYVYLTPGYHNIKIGENGFEDIYRFVEDKGSFEKITTEFDVLGSNLIVGEDYEYKEEEKTLRILSGKAVTVANKEGIDVTDHKIEVADSVSANITLAGVNISVAGNKYTSAFKIADNSTGDVTITLLEGTTNVLKSGKDCAGLQKNGRYSESLGTLTIQGKGSLEATGGYAGAGIGGGWEKVGSNIRIEGGIVTATGGYAGAGIGGGPLGAGSNITIEGGTVTAMGGARGAGIGGGSLQDGSDITIEGGTVTAMGGAEGAGIGGGAYYKGIDIVIRGGSVKAVPGTGAHAVGGGVRSDATIPTNSHENGEAVYLLTIPNPKEEKIYIDGEEYTPIKHTYYQNGMKTSEDKIYVYLTLEDHNIKIGDNGSEEVYRFVEEQGSFEKIDMEFDISGKELVVGRDYEYKGEEKILCILSGKPITIANKEGIDVTDHKIEVADSVSANITLAGVSISVSGNDSAFKIADDSTGDVTITLSEGTTNVLKSGEHCAGLQKNGEPSETLGTLTIQGKGILEAMGGDYGAGIGGGERGAGSNISIEGGTVTATGGFYGAGIGGGGRGAGSNISIRGGTVTALGGEYGAGIGGGERGAGSNISIEGGMVTATGGSRGAGIGGGGRGAGDNISIEGGMVTATGGSRGAGIGGGEYGVGSNITIKGGTVTATGGSSGAGIGGGIGEAGSNIVIRGGSVKAVPGIDANAIGGGGGMDATIPTNSSENGEKVYRHTIQNPNQEKIFIDGKEHTPIKHIYYSNGQQTSIDMIYVYLTPENHIIKIGENGSEDVYRFVEQNGNFEKIDMEVLENRELDISGNNLLIGKDYEYIKGEKTLRILSDKSVTISNKERFTETDHKIEVAGDISANITLAGVNISVSGNDSAFKIADNSTGDVTITLSEGSTNVLKSGENCAGLQKNGVHSETLGTLTIQGKGILEATGGDYGAGIGGGDSGAGSNISIEGGTITALGGDYGAGIGGGDSGAGSNISIEGGTVTALGGDYGAGIGGGDEGKGTHIVIRGGSVKVDPGSEANAIGGGRKKNATIPTNSPLNGEEVYLLIVANPKEEKIFIDGEEYTPIKHIYCSEGQQNSEDSVYIYLTGTKDHEVKVEDTVTRYRYDSIQEKFVVITDDDDDDNENTGEGNTAGDDTTSGNNPSGGDAGDGNNPGDDTTSENDPSGGDTEDGNTAGDDTTSGNTPSGGDTEDGNTAGDDTTSGNTPSGGDTGDDNKPGDGSISGNDPGNTTREGLWISGVQEQYTYTGSAIKPEVKVFDGDRQLIEKKEYTLVHKNNKNAYDKDTPDDKAPYVEIRMKGNYKGSTRVYYKIQPISLKDAMLEEDKLTAVVKPGKTAGLTPVLYWQGKKLKVNRDYTVEGNLKKVPAGESTISITGKGNFTGILENIPVRVYEGTDKDTGYTVVAMEKVKIRANEKKAAYSREGAGLSGYTLNAKPQTPVEGEYEEFYYHNQAAGTGYLVVRGTGKDGNEDGTVFVGTQTLSFKIEGTAMKSKNLTFTGFENLTYEEGKAICPTREFREDGSPLAFLSSGEDTLKEGIHYTVVYTKNIEKGTATATFTGIPSGGFTGTLKKTFRIQPAPIDGLVGEVSGNGVREEKGIWYVPFTKGATTPKVILQTEEGNRLVEGRDYTVTYSNHKKIGLTATATIKGKGNYGGSISLRFVPEKKELSNENGIQVVVNDKTDNGKSNNWRSTVKVLDSNQKALNRKDYDPDSITYTIIESENPESIGKELNPGDKAAVGDVIMVSVKGSGDYASTTEAVATGTYRILAKGKDIRKASIKLKEKEYTSGAITITADSDFVKAVLNPGKQQLEFGKDMEVVEGSYVKNVDKGTAKVTLRGIGEYGGTKTVTFKIVPRDTTEKITIIRPVVTFSQGVSR